MGKTFKDRKRQEDREAERHGWKADRQAARRDKAIQRGAYVSRRVERAKGGEE